MDIIAQELTEILKEERMIVDWEQVRPSSVCSWHRGAVKAYHIFVVENEFTKQRAGKYWLARFTMEHGFEFSAPDMNIDKFTSRMEELAPDKRTGFMDLFFQTYDVAADDMWALDIDGEDDCGI